MAKNCFLNPQCAMLMKGKTMAPTQLHKYMYMYNFKQGSYCSDQTPKL